MGGERRESLFVVVKRGTNKEKSEKTRSLVNGRLEDYKMYGVVSDVEKKRRGWANHTQLP